MADERARPLVGPIIFRCLGAGAEKRRHARYCDADSLLHVGVPDLVDSVVGLHVGVSYQNRAAAPAPASTSGYGCMRALAGDARIRRAIITVVAVIVGNATAVHGLLLARVTRAVAVRIALVCVCDLWAVVLRVLDAIAVSVDRGSTAKTAWAFSVGWLNRGTAGSTTASDADIRALAVVAGIHRVVIAVVAVTVRHATASPGIVPALAGVAGIPRVVVTVVAVTVGDASVNYDE